VVKLAQECGLVRLGTIAVDGTKIKANASRHKAMSYERMQKVELELTQQIGATVSPLATAHPGGDHAQSSFGGDRDHWVARMRELVIALLASTVRAELVHIALSGATWSSSVLAFAVIGPM
jgi:hypothetical protein